MGSRTQRWFGGFLFLTLVLTSGAAPTWANWSHDPFVNNPVATSSGTTTSAVFDSFSDAAGYTYYVRIDPGMNGASAQKLDPSGVPLWGGNSGITAFEEDLGVRAVVACTDGAGGMFVAIEDGTPSRIDSMIWLQHIDAAGNVLYTLAGLNATPGYSPLDTRTDPGLTADGSGGAFVAWGNLPDGATVTNIAGQHVDAAGSLLWGSTGLVLMTSAPALEKPQLISDATGGFWGLWLDYTVINFETRPHFRVAHYDGTGTSIGDQLLGSAFYGLEEAVMAPDNHGGVMIAGVVEGFGRIWLNHLDGLVQSYFGSVNNEIVAGTSRTSQVRLAVDQQGNCIVAWEDDRDAPGSGQSRPYAQKIDIGGNPLWAAGGSQVDASAFATFDPQSLDIAVTGDGAPVIVWEEGYAGTRNLYAQQLDATGAAKWPARLAVAIGAGEQSSPRLLADPEGGVIVAFGNQLTAGGDITLKAQRVGRYGNLGVAAPAITTITDVPQDQGGRVRLSWQASYLDVAAVMGVDHYTVWNRLPGAKAAAAPVDPMAATDVAIAAGMVPAGVLAVLADGWTYIDQVPATYLDQYGYNAPTFADSTGTGAPLTEFMVIAHQSSKTWPSAPQSGVSVDNLSPGAPLQLAANVNGATVDLNWLPSGVNDGDLKEYRIYRSTVPGFSPTPGDLVGTAVDPVFSEPFAAASPTWLYLVTAVDLHGNEGSVSNEAAVSAVSAVSGSDLPDRILLLGNHPNPFNPSTEISFDLPHAALVNLAVFDVAGRRVATLVRGLQPAGRSTLSWNGRNDDGGAAPSGVYFARLVAEDYRGVWKMVLAK